MIRLFVLLTVSFAGDCTSFSSSGGRNNDPLTLTRRPAKSSAVVLRGQSSPPTDELTDRGIATLREGRFDEASTPFRAALDEDGANASAHLNLGSTLRRQKDLAGAADSLRRAVDLLHDDDADADEALFQLGTVLSEMGYVDDAVDAFRRLVSREGPLDDDDGRASRRRRPSRAKIALANVLLDGRGLKADALAVFRKSCDCAGGLSPMAVPAGVVADSMGDRGAALEYYRDALRYDWADRDAALHLMIGLCRLGGDDGDEKNDGGGDEEGAALRSRLVEHVLSSWDYVSSAGVGADPSVHFFTYDMIRLALDACSPSLRGGLILEFGVYHGKTMRMIADRFPDEPVHGFDTFEGIPENWHATPRGSYSTHGALPRAPGNVRFHAGLFSETLPGFLEADDGRPVRFMNVDCDLYSSTKDVLECVCDRVVPGTVIVFDEYVLNPNWKRDEYRAFQEAVEMHGWQYEYIGISLVTGQAIVRIVDRV